MTSYRSSLLRLLDERGYIHQVTDAEALDALAEKEVVTTYIGFDATAPSLHVGSLVQIMMLRRFQQAGHRPIVLMGGGTTKVGDPSGKDESRKLLTDADIDANIAGIRKVFERFLTFGDGPSDAIMANNADWLDTLEYIPFLRDVGRHFTINRMLAFDSVKLRLDREQPLTFLEFNYMILQAYDFRELAQRYGCRLQMGGSDQWGNIVNGMELARRMDGWRVAARPLALVLGGSRGLSRSFLASASARWSLGPLTLPHELARVVVVEQLYRAFTILRGEQTFPLLVTAADRLAAEMERAEVVIVPESVMHRPDPVATARVVRERS